MQKKFWKHKKVAAIAASVANKGGTDALFRVNRYSTFQTPIPMKDITDNFDECSEAEYRAAFDKFPDVGSGNWVIDIVTGKAQRVDEDGRPL